MQKDTKSNLKCCIYARVSTEEQAERDLSIPFQLERCRYHAQGKGWEVVKEFIDAGESARTDKRPEFQKMVTAARSKEFDIILVHKFDRFARNDYDFVIYEKELEDLGVILESVSEPGDASTPAGYIGRRMMQIISTCYSKNLAVEAKKGMKQKVENGGWPKLAPPGYLNKHDKNSAWIEVDPELGPFISTAFKEMATGRWTLKEWADYAYSLGHRSRKGYPLAVSVWGAIFHNRFYLGETWLRKGDVPTKGTHEPLTDESIFTKVQQVLREHDKHKQRTQRHKYLLQGLLYSSDADSPCWVETHPKKKISYYRSKAKVDGKQIFYNTKDLDAQMCRVARDITLPKEKRIELERELDRWFEKEANGDGELDQAQERLTKLERVEKNLQRLAIEEEISIEDFKEHRARIEAERKNLKDLVEMISSRRSLVKGDFEIALQISSELDNLFNEGDNDERRLLCETIFKRVYVRNGKITNAELNSPFALIASRVEGSESFLTRQPLHFYVHICSMPRDLIAKS